MVMKYVKFTVQLLAVIVGTILLGICTDSIDFSEILGHPAVTLVAGFLIEILVFLIVLCATPFLIAWVAKDVIRFLKNS